MFYLTGLPFGLFVTIFFVFGVIIGSFLNVYLYRLHTGKSLMGSSHCLSCGNPLRAYELVPILSYLALRGRCRKCNSYIPKRYLLVELLTGLLFVGVALVAADIMSLLHLLFFVSVLVVIAVYDIYHLVIPDELVGSLMVTAMTYKFYLLIIGSPVQAFWFDVVTALIASLFLLSLWRVSKGTWIGFGDVKLVIPLALWVGYQAAFSMVVLAFWIGAVVGVLSILSHNIYRRGQPHLRFLPQELTMKSAIPFAPFLILGYLTVLFFGIDVISLLSYVPQ
ncbi:MAG: putative type IV leader peptidase/N-methyltransferase [Parcubacteria group bacterium GW2011_GWF2_44_8]|nr:MAG: putative type IV leader peptidase/N-methyltransferase [Parcubacteria group bacterium GW2011_GWF2_44_8]